MTSYAASIDLTKSTLVTFLLDKSGSMGSVKAPTIEAFNGYLDGLKEEPAGILFSFIQFDTISTDVINRNDPIDKVGKLTDSTYKPMGGTPLIDAAYKTIKAVEKAVAERNDPKVVICIQTDGEENSSREYTLAQLHDLIKEKSALGWQFNFMGAGIDAYAQAGRMGIHAVNTMSYNRDDAHATKVAFAASAQNTRFFAMGQSVNTNYSDAQRAASGDAFWDRNASHAQTQSVPPQVDIAQMKAAQMQARAPKPPVRKIVDDIDL